MPRAGNRHPGPTRMYIMGTLFAAWSAGGGNGARRVTICRRFASASWRLQAFRRHSSPTTGSARSSMRPAPVGPATTITLRQRAHKVWTLAGSRTATLPDAAAGAHHPVEEVKRRIAPPRRALGVPRRSEESLCKGVEIRPIEAIITTTRRGVLRQLSRSQPKI